MRRKLYVWMIAVFFVALTFDSIRISVAQLPRVKSRAEAITNCYCLSKTYEDGSQICVPINYLRPNNPPQMTRPPRPTLFRIWSPLIVVVISGFLIGALSKLIKWLCPVSYASKSVAAFMLICVFLRPIYLIASHPQGDYHQHKLSNPLFGVSIHENSLLDRYKTIAFCLHVSDGFHCQLPVQKSSPFPDHNPIPEFGSTIPPNYREMFPNIR
jgi:hypothetical protein